jgi:hypothetical protein
MKRSKIVVFYILVLSFSSCTKVLEPALTNVRGWWAARKAPKLLAEFESLNAKYLSCSAASECEALPLGSKPCGGPVFYLAASRKNPDFSRMKELAEEYARASDLVNQMERRNSTCEEEQPPEIECANQRCQAKPGT